MVLRLSTQLLSWGSFGDEGGSLDGIEVSVVSEFAVEIAMGHPVYR